MKNELSMLEIFRFDFVWMKEITVFGKVRPCHGPVGSLYSNFSCEEKNIVTLPFPFNRFTFPFEFLFAIIVFHFFTIEYFFLWSEIETEVKIFEIFILEKLCMSLWIWSLLGYTIQDPIGSKFEIMPGAVFTDAKAVVKLYWFLIVWSLQGSYWIMIKSFCTHQLNPDQNAKING